MLTVKQLKKLLLNMNDSDYVNFKDVYFKDEGNGILTVYTLDYIINKVASLTEFPYPHNATNIEEWINEGDISDMTIEDIAEEWNYLQEKN